MELKNATGILAIALSSCQWFDPRDVGGREEWQPHVYVNVLEMAMQMARLFILDLDLLGY